MQEVSRVSPRTQALLTKTEFQSILHVNPSSPALQFLAFLKKMAKTEVEEATSVVGSAAMAVVSRMNPVSFFRNSAAFSFAFAFTLPNSSTKAASSANFMRSAMRS